MPERPFDDTHRVDDSQRRRILRFSFLECGATFAGRYVIRDVLGAGGTGEVFRAEDQVSGLTVALKVLYPRGHGEGIGLDRLRREIDIVRALGHPGIVRVYDIGESDGLLYVLMECLDGETLRARLDSVGRLDLASAVSVMEQLLDALTATHTCRAVHRDIKPSNVFLRRNSESDRTNVVLLDFGLARRPGDRTLTSSGALLGTPEYLAPELVAGMPVTAACDIYGAGIVFWEMLAGTPPFSGDSSMKIAGAHLREPLPSPEHAIEALPRWCADLLRWMLEKEPSRRPGSAAEVRVALERRTGLTWRQRRRLGRTSEMPIVRRWILGGGLVALAWGLLAGWKHPVAYRPSGNRMVKVNLVDRAVGEIHLPFEVDTAVRIEDGASKGSYLMIQRGVASGENGAPFGLWRLDPNADDVFPVVLHSDPAEWDRGPVQAYEFFSAAYGPRGLRAIDWWRSIGREPSFFVSYENHTHYPAQAFIFRTDGSVARQFHHAGRLDPVTWQIDATTNDPSVLVLTATNNHLAQRDVIFGLTPTAQSSIAVALPPYDVVGDAQHRPLYYSFLSVYDRTVSELNVQGEIGTIRLAGGRTVRLNLRSGMPIDDFDRDMLTEEEWALAQERLLTALEASSSRMLQGEFHRAAEVIAGFTGSNPATSTQRGVAHGRAAELFQRAGDHEAALRHVRQAIAHEPLLAGHYRRAVDLAARTGMWDEMPAFYDTVPPAARQVWELQRDIVVAALLSVGPEKADGWSQLFESRQQRTGYYALMYSSLAALHTGRYDVAYDEARASIGPDSHFSFLAALAATLDQRDTQLILPLLGAAEAGRGDGNDLPFVPLRALLAARGADTPVARSDLLHALNRHALSSRRSIVDLYYSGWAWALARLAEPQLADEIDAILGQPAPAIRWTMDQFVALEPDRALGNAVQR